MISKRVHTSPNVRARTPTEAKSYFVPLESLVENYTQSKKRSCTDLCCLFIFIAFLTSWASLNIYATTHGDIRNLITPRDMIGQKCGIDSKVKEQPYLFVFDLLEFFNSTPYICVKQCPPYDFYFKQSFCEAGNSAALSLYKQNATCLYDIDPMKIASCEQYEKHVAEDKCARWWLKSKPFEYIDVCMPSELPKLEKTASAMTKQQIPEIQIPEEIKEGIRHLKQLISTYENFVEDVQNTWDIIAYFLLLAVVLCMILVILMRLISRLLLCLSIVAIFAASAYASFFCYKKYDELRNQPAPKVDLSMLDWEGWIKTYTECAQLWMILSILSGGLCIIVFCIVVMAYNGIASTLDVVKEGSKAVTSVWSSILFPIIPWTAYIALICHAINNALLIASIQGSIYTVKSSVVLPEFICLQVYNLFCLFWMLQFTGAVSRMTLVSTFTTWYWTAYKRKLPFFYLIAAIFQTIRYHLGTLAFGSLAITMCEYIRLIFCPIACIFGFDWICLKENAYVVCAMHGRPLLSSARIAHDLIKHNAVGVFALGKVTTFLFMMIKFIVTVIVGSSAYWYFAGNKAGTHFVASPVIAIIFCSYLIAHAVFSVCSVAVETVFLCLLEDCERNDGIEDESYELQRPLANIPVKKGAPMRSSYKK